MFVSLKQERVVYVVKEVRCGTYKNAHSSYRRFRKNVKLQLILNRCCI